MKKILALIFAVVAFGLVAYSQNDEAWKVTEFKMMPTDMDAKVDYAVKDPNGKQCALIKIETPYAGFTFSTGTLEVMKAEQHVGEWWVYVQKGVRKITIGHARGILREWQFPITINEGTVYVMKLKEGTSAEAAYSTAVAATTATSGFAVITSEPSGADVYIDGNWVGRTPFQKRYPMNTRLNVRCTMDKYHEDMALVTITSLKTEQHFVLSQAFGSLHMTSEPSGAEVFIGAETSSRGVTPITIKEVASGSVQVTLVKDLYAPIKQIIGVEDGRTTDYFVKLAPTYADITVNSLRGAAIKIDGVDKGTTTFKGPLSEGLHEVEATLASHKTVKQQIDVVAGFPQTIALNPIPIYGTLIVTSEPFESEVLIAGKSYGKTPLIVPDMLVGEYDVEVRKAGYATTTEHVVVHEGAEAEISPRLQTGGDVLLSTDTNGSTIYVDDTSIGVYNGTALRKTLSNGLHNVYAVNPDGEKSNVQSVSITPGAAAKSINLSFIIVPDYVENGVNLGKGIAVLGDWNGDGNKTYLYWAPVNCGYEEKGKLNSDSDHRLGKLYQWGAGDSSLPYYKSSKVVAREMYYDTATPSPWYGKDVINGTTSDKWNNNQGPCPDGWRLPTLLEFKVLCAGKNGVYGWVYKSKYAGQSNTYAGAEFFGANTDKTVGKGVFFPAAGWRYEDDGSARDRGSFGYYWSSTPYPYLSDYAYYLNFCSISLNLQNYSYSGRANAQSVRCVSE